MQVKKFEAPTIQEALAAVKRELGPDAIILQTKRNKRGFGLMNGASIEVTAAITDRAMQKKRYGDTSSPGAGASARSSAGGLGRHAAELFGGGAGSGHAHGAVSAHSARAPFGGAEGAELSMGGGLMSRARPASAPAAGSASLSAGASVPGARPRYADIDPEELEVPVPASALAPAPAPAPHGAKLPGRGLSLEDEVKHLKRMIEELKVAQEETGVNLNTGLLTQLHASPALMDAFEQLILAGVDKRYALGLVKKAGFELGPEESKSPDAVLDQIICEMMQSTETASPLEHLRPAPEAPIANAAGTAVAESAPRFPRTLALVGPTGVGKTTTIAKIAAEAILKRNLRVGFVNLDLFKLAAANQMETYAKILNVPFRSAHDADELRAALKDFQSLDLVLIDTTGRSQRDPLALKEMSDLLRSLEQPVQSHLVVMASTRETDAYEIAHRFAVFKPQSLVISKLDEAALFGSLYNLSHRAKLPLSWFTTGQRVPEDLEDASRERVASLIMDL